MTITIATKDHLPIIRDLAFKIWPKAYGEILSKAQLDYMLELIYSSDSLEKQLEKNHVFVLAKEDNNYIGFASYELNFENSNKTKIQKLYVLPEIQGKGIGKKLINYIIEKAIYIENSALILNVNKYNIAKDFYLKFGFKIIDSVVINIGNDYVMDDFIMEFKLM